MSGLGLNEIGDLSSLLVEDNNRWREIEINLIKEDLNQPRKADNPGFSADSLAELSATIKLRGVKSPISVRDDLDQPGHYIINHGARRYRASILAGKTMIPAFVDNDYNESDQIIENLQRDELTAREIANFIGRELARGELKKNIAASIGKSASFVSQHVTLLNLPDPINYAFIEGRTKDVTVINELVFLFKKQEGSVVRWLADSQQEITRKTVKLLREFIENKIAEKDSEIEVDEPASEENYILESPERGDVHENSESADISERDQTVSVKEEPVRVTKSDEKDDGVVISDYNGSVRENNDEPENKQINKKEKDPSARSGAVSIWVSYAEEQALLLINKIPTDAGYVWIQPMAGKRNFQVEVKNLKLLAVEYD